MHNMPDDKTSGSIDGTLNIAKHTVSPLRTVRELPYFKMEVCDVEEKCECFKYPFVQVYIEHHAYISTANHNYIRYL